MNRTTFSFADQKNDSPEADFAKVKAELDASPQRNQPHAMNQQNSIPSGRTISSFLHDHIVRTGATETEVGECLGVDQSQVSRWRRGGSVPRRSNMAALAELLGIDPHDLELVRVESQHVHANLATRKKWNLHKITEELEAVKVKIELLELKLAECLGADHDCVPAGHFVGDELDGQVTA
jgi:transcriptional regulator with XRE-family HTH domain